MLLKATNQHQDTAHHNHHKETPNRRTPARQYLNRIILRTITAPLRLLPPSPRRHPFPTPSSPSPLPLLTSQRGSRLQLRDGPSNTTETNNTSLQAHQSMLWPKRPKKDTIVHLHKPNTLPSNILPPPLPPYTLFIHSLHTLPPYKITTKQTKPAPHTHHLPTRDHQTKTASADNTLPVMLYAGELMSLLSR